MRRAVNITATVIISLAFILLGVLVFSSSYLRFGESCADFGQSKGYYFCEIFGIEHNIIPDVNTPPQVVTNQIKLPSEWIGFKEKAGEYFFLLIDRQNSILP